MIQPWECHGGMVAMYLFFSTFKPASSLGVHMLINIELGLKMKWYGVTFVTSAWHGNSSHTNSRDTKGVEIRSSFPADFLCGILCSMWSSRRSLLPPSLIASHRVGMLTRFWQQVGQSLVWMVNSRMEYSLSICLAALATELSVSLQWL